MKKGNKNYEEQLEQQISNTLTMLLENGLLYTYNDLKREHLDKNTIRLSWNNHLSGLFFASTFWRKLKNIFGECCISKLEKVAKPGRQLPCQPHGHCRQYLIVTA